MSVLTLQPKEERDSWGRYINIPVSPSSTSSLTHPSATTAATTSNTASSVNGCIGNDNSNSHGWQRIAARRRQEIYDAVPPAYLISPGILKSAGHNVLHLPAESGILTVRELELTSLSATRLLQLIHNETYTAVEVTTAFCKRAAVAHQATNCLALVMFEQALKDAAALDKYMKIHHKPKGPLHGLPISVKEHIDLKGTPATSGFIAWADEIGSEDALIVRCLRDAGAVFHVKTTNPQSLMCLETTSNLYGVTTNPHNVNLTPGGSSGGEGALIAMRGSVLGIGTDIGGSIRVPCGFSGIYGLKPSIGRLPHGGLAGVHSGMENIIGCVGPMAAHFEDLQLFCSVVLSSHPWLYEPPLLEIPWKSTPTLPSKPLRIGYVLYDGVVHPHPPVTRTLLDTIASLRRAGHTLIPWTPVAESLHSHIVTCINQSYFLDGGEEYTQVLAAGDEPAVPLLKWVMSQGPSRAQTVRETWKINKRREALQYAYAAQWNAAGLDCLLSPVNPAAASAHNESTYWGYSSVFNLLDYSAAVFPVGKVEEGDTWERFPAKVEGVMSEEDGVFRGYYSGPERYKDAPISLQLVGRRLREECVLGMVEEVLRVLHSSKEVSGES